MDKETILKHLEDGLKNILCMDIDQESKESVDAVISMFILEDASRYSAEELMTNFSTMEKGLTRFIEYLKSNIVNDGSSFTIH